MRSIARSGRGFGFVAFVCAAALIISSIAAWATHVIWIIRALASDHGATVSQMVLGALGAFMPPVGVIHGWIIWFS